MSRMSKHSSFMHPPTMTFEEKLRRYRAIFDSIDGDGSGSLDPQELEQAVVALGLDETSVSEVFGVSGGSSLSFDKFVEAMESYEAKLAAELSEEEKEEGEDSDDSMAGFGMLTIDSETAAAYRRLFDELDVKKQERLTAEDLHNYIRNLSLREASMSSEELNFYFALVEEADSNADGYIDIEGFADVAEGHKEFIDSYKKRGNHGLQGSYSRNSKFMSSYTSHGSIGSKSVAGKELLQYRQVFDEFDQEKKGRVSGHDVQEMMNRLGRIPTESESEFLFELLRIVGEEGFSFEEFVELMQEGPIGMAELGRNVSAWKMRQTHRQNVKSVGVVKANLSRMGLRSAIEQEDARVNAQEAATLERINGRLSKDAFRDRPSDGFGAGFTFLPANSKGQMPYTEVNPGIPMYPTQNQMVGMAPGGPGGQLMFASALLTPLELLRYQAVFNALDLDKDGRVTFSEMTVSTKGVTGRQPTDQEIREFIQEADSNGNGSMEFEEFVVIMQKTKRALGRVTVPNSEFAQAATKRKLDKYRLVFDSFDTNRDGKITPDELKGTLQSLGKAADESAVANIFSTYDRNRSGGLEFEEFCPLMDQLVAKELNL